MSIIKISHKAYPKLNMSSFEAHGFYELYFLIKGNRTLFINDQIFQATDNSFFCIPPRTLHRTMGNEQCERINIYISEDLLTENNIVFLNSHNCSHIRFNETNAFIFLHLLYNASKEEYIFNRDELTMTVNTLLFYLQSIDLTIQGEQEHAVLSPILQYINQHFSENITISLLQKEFFISRATLFRLFDREMKTTPIEYLLNYRLTQSQNLLTTTSHTMVEIANRCGFHSANYFSLIFKKKFGLSPMQYRKNQHLDYQ